MPAGAVVRAHVDDAVLMVRPQDAPRAWKALKDGLSQACLCIKAPKCSIWLQQKHPCDCHPLSTITAACPDVRGLHLAGIRTTAWTEVPLPLGHQ
eukprot:2083839-Amphidinium_carterae.1